MEKGKLFGYISVGFGTLIVLELLVAIIFQHLEDITSVRGLGFQFIESQLLIFMLFLPIISITGLVLGILAFNKGSRLFGIIGWLLNLVGIIWLVMLF